MIDLTQSIVNSHWSDLILYLGQYRKEQYQFALRLTYQQFWETCPRGEWLLDWIAKEGNTNRKLIVYAACQCARLALPYCTDQQQRPLKAIETTEKWIRGEATLKEVKQAGDAVRAAYYDASDFSSFHASAYHPSSYHTFNAAYYAASATATASDVSDAAFSAVFAAYYAAPKNKEAARQSMQLQTADLVRSLIPRPDKMVKEYEQILRLKAFL